MVRVSRDNDGEGVRRQRWGGCQETTMGRVSRDNDGGGGGRVSGDNDGEGVRRQRW